MSRAIETGRRVWPHGEWVDVRQYLAECPLQSGYVLAVWHSDRIVSLSLWRATPSRRVLSLGVLGDDADAMIAEIRGAITRAVDALDRDSAALRALFFRITS